MFGFPSDGRGEEGGSIIACTQFLYFLIVCFVFKKINVFFHDKNSAFSCCCRLKLTSNCSKKKKAKSERCTFLLLV